jgi:tetratricopeptide (TPR) repeat protein
MRLIAMGSFIGALSLCTVAAATKATNLVAEPSDSGAMSKTAASPTNSAANVTAPAPSTPREHFNAGTEQLHAGKFREAEAFLESALASQKDDLRNPTLYNLGHVRFDQGLEELKKNGPASPKVSRGSADTQQAADAIRKADDALAGDDVPKMVAAYMHGRGVKKELKSATTAVEQALAVYRATLTRWERASDDFKGAMEVKSSDADAGYNAEVVDRCIAKLVDSVRKMEQCKNGMDDKGRELGEKLKKLKGRIPAPNMPPGAAGDDEEDEDFPNGQKPGQKEGPTKEGKQEIALSPEQASWLLDGFKLDSERRLPMGQGPVGDPKERNRPTW